VCWYACVAHRGGSRGGDQPPLKHTKVLLTNLENNIHMDFFRTPDHFTVKRIFASNALKSDPQGRSLRLSLRTTLHMQTVCDTNLRKKTPVESQHLMRQNYVMAARQTVTDVKCTQQTTVHLFRFQVCATRSGWNASCESDCSNSDCSFDRDCRCCVICNRQPTGHLPSRNAANTSSKSLPSGIRACACAWCMADRDSYYLQVWKQRGKLSQAKLRVGDKIRQRIRARKRGPCRWAVQQALTMTYNNTWCQQIAWWSKSTCPMVWTSTKRKWYIPNNVTSRVCTSTRAVKKQTMIVGFKKQYANKWLSNTDVDSKHRKLWLDKKQSRRVFFCVNACISAETMYSPVIIWTSNAEFHGCQGFICRHVGVNTKTT